MFSVDGVRLERDRHLLDAVHRLVEPAARQDVHQAVRVGGVWSLRGSWDR